MQRGIRLTLGSPIYYRKAGFSLSEAEKKADSMQIGYDAIIHYSYVFKDEHLVISPLSAGEREGYTEEERKIIENGGVIQRKEEESEELPAGKYLFEQLPFLPEEKDLMRIILPYAMNQKGEFYARIYKENILECVFQLLFPSL